MKPPHSKEEYKRNAEIYKFLSNPIRLEILNLLKIKELTVSQLVEIMNLTKSNISQHLQLLKLKGLVKDRRSGVNVYYSLTYPEIVEPCNILNKLQKKNFFK